MNTRYRKIYALLMATMLTIGSAEAQVTINGSVFGGGNEAAVKVNTEVNIGGGSIDGNVYGGGNVGSVGTYTTSADMKTFTFENSTGVCNVTITGGTVGTGVSISDDGTFTNGNVYGAGKGEADTYWCEKAMVYKTNVTVEAGTVNGTIYGGGQIGRVENDATVRIGVETPANNTPAPTIIGNVFGAGAGLATHGYSALLRGDTEVTVQGNAQVGLSVYGGGEKASVGRFKIVGGLPSEPQNGGTCKVTVKGSAKIGTSGTDHNVYGSCQGVAAPSSSEFTAYNKSYKSMQTAENAPDDTQAWEYIKTYPGEYSGQKYIWEYYPTLDAYKGFLNTLALASHTDVEIGGDASVYGSVFGGGQMGITLGNVKVDITGGTVYQDVYGGGALADTNKGNQTAEKYDEKTGLIVGESSVYGLYEKGEGDAYTIINDTEAKAEEGKTYYTRAAQSSINTTTVNLIGGMIKGDAYGGGLGQLGDNPIPAMVYGDVAVNQGTPNVVTDATAYTMTYLTDDNGKQVVNSGRIFGCNNLNGSPKGNVTVTVNGTVTGKDAEGNNLTRTEIERNRTTKEVTSVDTPHVYEVAAVYGGGNLANYTPEEGVVKVIINSCDVSINQVYGGGNAAEVPSTDVLVNGAHEIEQVFGGGNGKDKYYLNGSWHVNQGANVNGNANTLIKGGLVHEAYGGSNELGTITGNITIDAGSGGLAACPVKVEKLVGAGKNADVNGDLIMIMGCKDATKIPIVYGGADNANVNGNVELTITSGHFGQVFGGNNLGGIIKGHIYLNIEETSECEPITIDDLYLGGNQAAYSRYGYYVQTTTTEGDNPSGQGLPGEEAVLRADGKLTFKPRTSADDTRKPVKTYDMSAKTWTVYQGTDEDPYPLYEEPELNIISCTSIGRVFGGGLGEGAAMYADPTVNINMILGSHATNNELGEIGVGYTDANNKRVEGGVFGGGNEAAVYGNTTVNIGTETSVNVKSWSYNSTTKEYTAAEQPVLGANVTGNVYGGGNEADVTGNTYVNICAKEADDATTEDVIEYSAVSISSSDEGVTIGGNVFGGGKGIADSFVCDKAMVGVANTNDGNTIITKESINKGTRVSIGNGTVNGTVYGGGEVGRVEWNGVVTIGLPVSNGETSAPEINGDVYGAGKGVEQYGYAALLRGNTFVTIQADAKVGKSVYGGGEIASVGKYNIVKAEDLTEAFKAEHPELEEGMPWSLANQGSGYCNVIVRGNAEIGPDNMVMYNTTTGEPDDWGHVFGAGRGILPYENEDDFKCQKEGHTGQKHPGRMAPGNVWECYDGDEAKYLSFVETQALATQTNVTIGGDAFVKGSVYGGSMNGHVQHNTHVTIQGDCQIGAGYDTSAKRSLAKYSSWPTETENITTSWNECAHWDYDASSGAPYDPYATILIDGKYYYDKKDDKGNYIYAEGGSYIGKDGHTYYGNVFGGGSGVIPYAPGKWHRASGSVGGNTLVDITGGHILTSVYGGNEQTDVGTYTKDSKGALVVPVRDGKCTINMTGGTIGVPRTEADAKAHPVTCYLFGAGKGDQRIFFNTWTNVIETEVNISGNARIYGSTFGGGEDGHIIRNSVTNISGNVIIGTTGTSYVDGNVFGGGRGFSGDAQTAGTVGGNVEVNISGGHMLGNIYGGGRLASVGTQFTAPDDPNYGNFIEDETGADAKTYGHVIVNISGGTIGNGTGNNVTADADGKIVSGNVFGGSMGRLDLLDGTRNPIWPKMAQVKTSAVNIYGSAKIMRSVYGGGELGSVRDDAVVTVSGGTVRRDVYGGGYGSEDRAYTIFTVKEPNKDGGYDENTYAFTPMQFAGCVGKSTTVTVSGGYIRKSVYGGGEMASVGIYDCKVKEVDAVTSADVVVREGTGTSKSVVYKNMVKHANVDSEFALSWPYKFNYVPGFDGATHVNITGGRIGVKGTESESERADVSTDNGDVYGAGKGQAGDYKEFVFCANVGSTNVNINHNSSASPANFETGDGDCIAGAVYGGGEDGHVMGDTKLTLAKGLIGHSVYGGGSGKGRFTQWLEMIPESRRTVVIDNIGTGTAPEKEGDKYKATCYSITAGKVFGNTEIEMTGGTVVRNVYGGGNMGSVGKGNYAGGPDDYSTAGYGEKLTGTTNLWDDKNEFSTAFLHSGKCTVKIKGGTIGYIANNPSESMYPLDSNKQPYAASLPYGNVFGGCRGESAPNILESQRYLYCPEFFVGYANETEVTIEGDDTKILGSVYGGGMDGHIRRDAHVIIKGGEIGIPFTDENKTGVVKTSDPNNIQWLARGNVYGSGSGIGKYKYDFNYDGDYVDKIDYTRPGSTTPTTMMEEDFSTSAGSVTRFTKVEIQGGTIYRNVYGGGSLSSIGAPKIPPITDNLILRDDNATDTQGKQTLNEVIISGGQIGDATSVAANYGGHVFGGSRGDASLNSSSFSTSMFTKVNVGGGKVLGSVFGGGEVGIVKGSVAVNVTGGEVVKDVYGGGALANTNTNNWDASANDGAGNWADATKKSSLYTTTVNLLGGTINDAYGGGLGQRVGDVNGGTRNIEAIVFGDVNLNLNGLEPGDYDSSIHGTTGSDKLVASYDEDGTTGVDFYRANAGCIVTGYIFGCNNINGTPKGHSKVHVFKTQPKPTQQDTDYDVDYVFGGGNQADYVPKDEVQSTEVIIEGCDLTKILEVYGGGNAAATPGTHVIIKGTKLIDNVFGGGYGKGEDNPGANVGKLLDGTAYGLNTNDANYKTSVVQLMAGKINNVYGGSNSKGDIRGGASITKPTPPWRVGVTSCCENLSVDNIYGGGKEAEMSGGVNIVMGCTDSQDWVNEIYPGSEAADIGGNVTLTITSGKFGRVFGGNNKSGKLNGSITINIEENGACGVPVIIGEIYGGGNKAPYSVYGYDSNGTMLTTGSQKHANPQINARAFTSIGNIYGGGLGSGAVMYGSPTVNINEVGFDMNADDYKSNAYSGENKVVGSDEDQVTVTLHPHTNGAIGAVNNVFGGGNAARVEGNTTVNVGTTEYEYLLVTEDLTEGTTDVSAYYTRTGAGTTNSPFVYTKSAENAKAETGVTYYKRFDVVGADIRGNVYGGGNKANVTGNTNVTIGKAVTP